jgi:hypothetical protein
MKTQGFFNMAADDGAGASGAGGAGGAADAAKAAADKAAADAAASVAKYTDEQVNEIVKGKEAAAVAKILKEAGVESTGKLKDDLKALKEFQDSRKTEAEKTAETLKAKDSETALAKREAEEARAEVAAVRLGVDPDKAAKVVKLALAGGYEGDTVADKVKAVLADFPEFKKGEGKGEPVPDGLAGKVKNQGGTAMEQANSQLDKIFGKSKAS